MRRGWDARHGARARLRPIVVVLLGGAATLGLLVLLLSFVTGPAAPRREAAWVEVATERAPASPSAAQGIAVRAEIAALNGEAESLRARIATEKAQLEALEQQRAALVEQIAALRREAASGATASAGTLAARANGVASDGGGAASIALPLPPPPPPEPPGMGRVFVHHRAGSSTAEDRAASIGEAVREAGFSLAGIRPVGGVPAARVVRFYHAADAGAAARLAARLGPGWTVQDFRAFGALPPPQTLEVWLPDR